MGEAGRVQVMYNRARSLSLIRRPLACPPYLEGEYGMATAALAVLRGVRLRARGAPENQKLPKLAPRFDLIIERTSETTMGRHVSNVARGQRH